MTGGRFDSEREGENVSVIFFFWWTQEIQKGGFSLFFIFNTTEVEEVSDNSWQFPSNTKKVWAAAELIAGVSSNFIPVKVSLINILINVR